MAGWAWWVAAIPVLIVAQSTPFSVHSEGVDGWNWVLIAGLFVGLRPVRSTTAQANSACFL